MSENFEGFKRESVLAVHHGNLESLFRTEDIVLRHSVALVGQVNREVCDHAAFHELLLNKLPGNFQILLHGEFVLQGKIKTVGKLRLGMPLRLLHCVPEFFAVFVFLRSEGRK